MRKLISFAFALTSFSTTALAADRHIAFERSDAVYIADLDGSNEKKIADGIFPAISPDGTRVAFNTTEKKSDTTYVRHLAVVDVATGKLLFSWRTDHYIAIDESHVAPSKNPGVRWDYFHLNSIAIDPDDGNLVIYSPPPTGMVVWASQTQMGAR